MKILAIMAAIFSATGAGAGADTGAASGAADMIPTRDGKELKINFFGHGSVGFEFDGRHIYVDPVSDYADYAALPKADLVLVTHEHGDHLDAEAIGALFTPASTLIGNATAIQALSGSEQDQVLAHGEVRQVHGIRVEAIAAYNTSPEKQNFHPAARKHNGYILTFGGTTVYVAGDSEPTPEMVALGERGKGDGPGPGIDIAFLPVNLPYTMTEEQAATAARAIAPHIFYPYHYGGTDHKTDLTKLAALLDGSGIDLRVRPLE